MTKKKSENQSPLEKIYSSLQELIKRVWIPVAGIIGAILLLNQLAEIWDGNPTRVNYIIFWVLITVWVLALATITFGRNVQKRKGFFARKTQFRNNNIPIYNTFAKTKLKK